jgi:hypothetical protein
MLPKQVLTRKYLHGQRRLRYWAHFKLGGSSWQNR